MSTQGITTEARLLARVEYAVQAHQQARQNRDAAIADALNAGLPHLVVADATGHLSPSAIRKIRRAYDEAQR